MLLRDIAIIKTIIVLFLRVSNSDLKYSDNDEIDVSFVNFGLSIMIHNPMLISAAGTILILIISRQSTNISNNPAIVIGPKTSPILAPKPCMDTARPLLLGNLLASSPRAGG